MYLIYVYGIEDQCRKYLFKFVIGEWVGCFGLIEFDYGFDFGSMVMIVVVKDGGFVFNGVKMWIINLLIVDLVVVWVKFDGKICGFVVECEFEGFFIFKIEGKFLLCVLLMGEIVL